MIPENMYMWVLDFSDGTVHKYDVSEVFWDDDINMKIFYMIMDTEVKTVSGC